jgi:hypothetical protein
MCLIVEVLVPAVDRASAGVVSKQASQDPRLLQLMAQRQPKTEQGARFRLCEPGQGCACSLLADSADWSKPTFELETVARDRLIRTLKFLSEVAGVHGFLLYASWTTGDMDNSFSSPMKINLSSLVESIDSRGLPNALVHHVRAAV